MPEDRNEMIEFLSFFTANASNVYKSLLNSQIHRKGNPPISPIAQIYFRRTDFRWRLEYADAGGSLMSEHSDDHQYQAAEETADNQSGDDAESGSFWPTADEQANETSYACAHRDCDTLDHIVALIDIWQ
ncbi:MAG: hypothetical protein CVV42_02300 [Candidatus Riflebacteria bacterium HGW-Riflebacteria-2]|nr:MAG: hypothetical protein CVV42_02300 [Candidatus Riflebacteria bacterium HGW-Riflebacteria-2]